MESTQSSQAYYKARARASNFKESTQSDNQAEHHKVGHCGRSAVRPGSKNKTDIRLDRILLKIPSKMVVKF